MSENRNQRPSGTWLGFDYGFRRIGVAVGQTITAQANPVRILTADQGRPDWAAIEGLIQEWRPRAMVVGLPRHADGSDNEVSPRARRFARQLEGRFHRPVYLVDEALSSHAAREQAVDRAADAAIDDWAAACILQDALGGAGQRLEQDSTQADGGEE